MWIYNPVIEQNYRVVDAEGDFRASIRHVMTNAETVALYGGEDPERWVIIKHLRSAVRLRLRRCLYAMWINLAQGGFSTIWLVLPFVFLAPAYFRHELEYGTIAQGIAATALVVAVAVAVHAVHSIVEPDVAQGGAAGRDCRGFRCAGVVECRPADGPRRVPAWGGTCASITLT